MALEVENTSLQPSFIAHTPTDCSATVIRKFRSVGGSWIAPVEPVKKMRHLLLYLPEFACSHRRERYMPMLIGQVSRVLYFERAPREMQKADYIRIVYKRLADIVDLSANIFALGIGQESDGDWIVEARRQVAQLTRRRAPDCMKLCLDKDAWHLPDRPAVQLFSAMHDDVFWDDSEAFKRWLVNERAMRDAQRGLG